MNNHYRGRQCSVLNAYYYALKMFFHLCMSMFCQNVWFNDSHAKQISNHLFAFLMSVNVVNIFVHKTDWHQIFDPIFFRLFYLFPSDVKTNLVLISCFIITFASWNDLFFPLMLVYAQFKKIFCLSFLNDERSLFTGKEYTESALW